MKKKVIVVFILLIGVLPAYYFAPYYPDFFTEIYHQKWYLQLDKVLGWFTNTVSFSVGDVLYALVIIFLVYQTVVYIRMKKFKSLALFIATATLLFFGLFQLFWGFNNYKYSVFHQLTLDKTYSEKELENQTYALLQVVNEQHIQLTNNRDQKVIIEKDLNRFNITAKQNYNRLPNHLQNVLITNAINDVKPSLFSKVQSYMGFSGYFNPFTHENQVNIEIPTIGMPITVAHEMAHQLGIASETEANFFGYMVMLQSDDLAFQYAANLYALKYCLKQYRNQNEETYQLLFNLLTPGVQQNIVDTEQFWQSKRNVSSFFFKHLYGRFLKINNQKEGIQSYNRFVGLLINYNKKFHPID